jgi:two-component system, LytTR family, sensor kinase
MRHFRIALFVWMGYSGYRVVQTVLLAVAVGQRTPSIPHRVLFSIIDGATIAVFTPLLIEAGGLLPIERPHRVRNIVLHLLLAFACAMLTLTVLFTLGRAVGEPQQLGLLEFNLLSLTDILFAYLVIVAGAQAVLYAQRWRRHELHSVRLESQLTAARLDSLKAQLQPHFLFNTLNGISELIHANPRRADAMVLRLAQLLRATLDTHTQEVPLARELEMLRSYFDIQRMRFDERVQVEFDIEPAASDALVPAFLLQPLAENAVRHGIAPRSTRGMVAVHASVLDETLVLEVLDDGVGIAPGHREGVGLRNTRRRLTELYPGLHEMTIARRPEGGTAISISLPLRFSATAAASESDSSDLLRV